MNVTLLKIHNSNLSLEVIGKNCIALQDIISANKVNIGNFTNLYYASAKIFKYSMFLCGEKYRKRQNSHTILLEKNALNTEFSYLKLT